MRFLRLPPVAALFLVPFVASAIQFPDVDTNYAHRSAIEALADREVIGGNPDGTFRPHNPVDRASMLKMLYVAKGMTPDSSKRNCFNDVQPGSWYEPYVCDASARGYVKGYEGNQFKPGRPVSRAEALKLVIVILGIGQADTNVAVHTYTDVSAADWFFVYVRTALAKSILPIAGQEGSTLQSHIPLERGEAAAYIWNGLHPKDVSGVTAASSSSVSFISRASSSSTASARKRVDDPVSTDEIVRKSVPFTDARVLSNKQPLSYRFTLSVATVIDVSVSIDLSDGGSVTCRLYRLTGEAISDEYYLGVQDGRNCKLRAALVAGEYQLQVQPTAAGSRVAVDVRAGKGDGNDGFSQAKLLTRTQLQTGLLDSNDVEDWFTFTVGPSTSQSTIPGTELTVRLTSTDDVGCLVYSRSDVDLFGFSGPQCNTPYLYPQGTYMVSVRHSVPLAGRQTYTLELR